MNLLQLLGLPAAFGATLLGVSLVLALGPYFSGFDFGIIRIPEFSPSVRARLRFIGPLALIGSVGLHLPLFSAPGTASVAAPETVRAADVPDPPNTCDDPNDVWWSSGKWRIDANARQDNLRAVPHGWNAVFDPKRPDNRPPVERQGVLVLHPLDELQPAVVTLTSPLPTNARVLAMAATGSPVGDGEIQALVDGKRIGSRIVDGARWYSLNYDLPPGSERHLQIRAVAGGTRKWYFETIFIDSICFRP